MRRPIIAGNWKMHMGRHDEALPFVRSIRHALNEIGDVDRILCPPLTSLAVVADSLAATQIGLGAQNMHWEQKGAHTGEISPSMLTEQCQHAHSLRGRKLGAERGRTDACVRIRASSFGAGRTER